ncbi:MAG: S41 family peptidase [Acholeplasmataceae bacterium]
MAFRGIKRLFLIVLLVFTFALTGCQLNVNVPNPKPSTPHNSDPQIMEVFTYLNSYYYKNFPIDVSKVKSVDELLSYTDRYTQIITTTRSIDMGEKYIGLGLTISEHEEGILITDINTLTNSDEFVYVGDIITHVKGTPLKGLSFEEKAATLKGNEGDEKLLTIKRFNDSVNVTMTLFEVPFKSIEYQKIDTYGYIRILRFADGTDEAFADALEDLESKNIEGLLIDVRDNGGGYLSSAVNILKLFINDTEPYLYLYSPKSNQYNAYVNEPITEKTYPIKVLVNNNSASASEVVSGTLKQYNHKLIGEKTFGKDVYQTSVLLKTFQEGTYLSITGGYWLLNDKTSVEGGIEVDIHAPQSGVLALDYPVVYQTFEKGESHPMIKTYQYLLSINHPSFYEPGLFDDYLEAMILAYQEANSIPTTKTLDAATQLHLIDYYRTLIKDRAHDHQLTFALSQIGA